MHSNIIRITGFPIAVLLLAHWGYAQGLMNSQPLSGQPRRPSLSPYLNLARDNSGALPSYQAFVLPRLEQNQQLISQYLLQTQTRKLEQSLATDPNVRATGMGGKFQNRTHFYPQTSTAPPRR
jgi:hypothetical protein